MAKRLPTYRSDEITVTFDPVRCIHARRCVQGRDTRVALCRCGHSTHMPFCDGSHESAGFRA